MTGLDSKKMGCIDYQKKVWRENLCALLSFKYAKDVKGRPNEETLRGNIELKKFSQIINCNGVHLTNICYC